MYGICVWPNVDPSEQCRDRWSQVTETVGPSVVKTQKSSDKFCSIEWSKRRRVEEASPSCSVPVHAQSSLETPTSPGRGHYDPDHQPGVNLINTANTARETLLLIYL